MSRRSNVGRVLLVLGAAAAVAGLLSSAPPEGSDRELRAAAPAPASTRPAAPITTVRPRPTTTTTSRPKATTTTPARPKPTTTTRPSAVVTTTVPPTTVVDPAAPPTEEPPAAEVGYYPGPSAYEDVAEPETQDDSSAGPSRPANCQLFSELIAILDDPSLRTAVTTVGCA